MISPVKIWRNQKYIASKIGLVGRIISWSLIRVPPDGFSDQAPYPIAVVEFENGNRILSQVVDWEQDDLKHGKKVKTVVRRTIETTQDGVIPYGIKVKPL